MTTTININLSAEAPVFNVTLGDGVSFFVSTVSPVAFGAAAGTATQGNDPRLSDARQPLAHKEIHSIGGTDRILPIDIGAQSLFETESVTLTNTTPYLLTSARAKTWNISSYTSSTAVVVLPATGGEPGDIAIIKANTIVGVLHVRLPSNAVVVANFNGGDKSLRFVYTNGWAIEPVAMHIHTSTDITNFTAAVTAIVNAIRPL